MAEKRKDTKGRILKDGESQLKDGRYMYRYIDGNGNRKCVYSWRLVSTDPHPAGNRHCLPHRSSAEHRPVADGSFRTSAA